MKRIGNLYKQICAIDNLKLAHKNARRGKGWYDEVKVVDINIEYYLSKLQDMLVSHTYKTSAYEVFIKNDGEKERKIYKLPYFPDRICQWAILQIIEPHLLRTMITHTYSAIPNRGIHTALRDVQDAMRKDVSNCQFCLKMDVKHYYQSISHNVLKGQCRRLFKDAELLWLLDEIIDSVSTAGVDKIGIPIGNYLSQWCGNLYLSCFDHWLKEKQRVKHYFRYMDDIVIFRSNKRELHRLQREIAAYLFNNLQLTVKENWQVFPSYTRGVDFVGYRTFLDYTLLRKSTCKNLKTKMVAIHRKTKSGQMMSYSDWCSVNSYKGWLRHCDSFRLQEKYITPIQEDADRYYREVVKNQKHRKAA